MSFADKVARKHPKPVITCPCGRLDENGKPMAGADPPGVCDACLADGARAFWLLMENKITLAGFFRRLRKASRR